ncbi:MAG: 16S rRNA (adenine(1518)-N(6)/adenine(1519)-N(6))-dimethyltransferase RsmA [Crocinitomicaceae bacterium]|nr:16S rRNA (adenine(1518)-N(6)/adenine(1519)-N(6))-dimethyltransferase RsmA [Crocinitomicaceae bacterium]
MKVTPKKHLGQHFLKDETVSQRIAALVQKTGVKNILEIGPGTGALTKELLKYPELNVQVIEIDRESIAFLAINYPDLKVHTEDFLKANLSSIMGNDPFAVVGNFPYNISTQIIFKVLENIDQVEAVVGMFQKEVAARFASGPGSKTYGITSVLAQVYYDAEYHFSVDEDAFIPPPKVKSGVISLIRNKVTSIDCDEKLFQRTVKMSFNQRRKTLRNSLKQLWTEAGLDIEPENELFRKRPEQLSVRDFIELTQHLTV